MDGLLTTNERFTLKDIVIIKSNELEFRIPDWIESSAYSH